MHREKGRGFSVQVKKEFPRLFCPSKQVVCVCLFVFVYGCVCVCVRQTGVLGVLVERLVWAYC